MNSFNIYSDIVNISVGKTYNFTHKDIPFLQFIGVLEQIHIQKETKKYDFSNILRFDEDTNEWVEWKVMGDYATFERITFGDVCDDNPY